MSELSNMQYLLTKQYQNAANLRTRIHLHKKFSTNAYGWFPWVFDHFDLPPSCKILELGCGPGDLWFENMARIPPGWQIALSDFSAGMLEQTRQLLQDQPPTFTFELINAQSIPYEQDYFDAVIANHMLYHLSERARALSEICRVLKAGGHFYATTVGEGHMQELSLLLRKFDENLRVDFQKTVAGFSLENGRALLETWFSNITVQRYVDELIIAEPMPLADYLMSSFQPEVVKNQRDALIAFIESEMDQSDGCIRITKDSGIFIAS